MIISRTPFRISFFGGGTDYPDWYYKYGGAVLSTTIDKYCYITSRYLPPFFNCKHKIAYSRIEHVLDVDEIKHPAVREIIRFMNINKGLEIHTDADLPARSGLGSSSSFTVGLLNNLYALKGQRVSKERLGMEAIHIEQNLLKENVGSQDQFAAAYGGLNKIEFKQDGSIHVRPVICSKEKRELLQSYLLLFFTHFTRRASQIAGTQVRNIPKKEDELFRMYAMVDEALSILRNQNGSIKEFGQLLHEAWKVKRTLSDKITTPMIDEIYNTAYKFGAYGGKLIGAGGGGFMVFIAPPDIHQKIRQGLRKLLYVPICLENEGSDIIYYNP